jgi:hypothetical protein
MIEGFEKLVFPDYRVDLIFSNYKVRELGSS